MWLPWKSAFLSRDPIKSASRMPGSRKRDPKLTILCPWPERRPRLRSLWKWKNWKCANPTLPSWTGTGLIGIPLADPDPDVPLAFQTALEQVYDDGSYMLRVKYDEPCVPSLAPKDQEWAFEHWSAYRQAHLELFPDGNGR